MAKVFALSEGSYQRGTDYDIVMLYQVLLGRNPENSQVIVEHRANPLSAAFETFIRSTEFRENVLAPIKEGAPLRRHDIVPRPSPEQLNWLFSRTVLDDGQKAALRQAGSWEQFFQYMLGLEGFLDPLPAPARTARPAIPFRPIERPQMAAVVQPPVAAAAEFRPGPSNAALMERLERIEMLLAALCRHLLPVQSAAAEKTGPVVEPAGSEASAPKPAGDPAKPRVNINRQAR